MNIFFLSLNPRKAARMQCDKHVVKMILETAQLLCTTIRLIGDPDCIPLGLLHVLYRATHKNHPSARWVRESKANFEWTLEHGLALCAEYTCRYGKVHKTQAVLEAILRWYNQCALNFTYNDITPRPMCMNLEYRTQGPSIQEDVVDSYWRYYAYEKERFAKWNHGLTPDRWTNELERKRKRESL